jgi:sulfoxide reductase heme-binding subunit YedZ
MTAQRVPRPGWIGAAVPQVLAAQPLARLRAAVFVVALLPLARLVWLGATASLGANPVEFVLRALGASALALLVITLSVTPLRLATGWAWLLRLRRMLGLFTFFYAALHFTAYVWLDQWFDVAAIAADVAKRPYVTAGLAALLLLVPLAVTSTNGWVRRLGAANWQRLHRLVYLIAPLAVLHLWWQRSAKNDLGEPLAWAGVVALLLGLRLLRRLRSRYGRVDSEANSSSTGSRRRTS